MPRNPASAAKEMAEMATRVAINGLGRIGRLTLRGLMASPELDVVAINDLAGPDQIAYLLRHDSVHGSAEELVVEDGDLLRWGAGELHCLQEPDPSHLPWETLGVEIVIEATGVFRSREEAARHLEAGARRVIVTAPVKGPDLTVCMGVNHDDYDPGAHAVLSNASCTTNCLAPVAQVLDDAFGIETGFLSTVHAVTGGQSLVDQPHKKIRRGRSALANIVPTTTGAAEATGEVLPRLAGRMDGMAVRVPVVDGSLVDFVCCTEQPVDVASVNERFREAAQGALTGILGTSEDELVSTDVIGSGYSALVDLPSTMVVGTYMVKVLAWYDNEWGYASRVVDLAHHVATRS
jgi:glyceraldehyde 3-phosphate dehydrogenase